MCSSASFPSSTSILKSRNFKVLTNYEITVIYLSYVSKGPHQQLWWGANVDPSKNQTRNTAVYEGDQIPVPTCRGISVFMDYMCALIDRVLHQHIVEHSLV